MLLVKYGRRRVVHDDAGLLFALIASKPNAAHAQPSAGLNGVAKIGVEPTVDEWVVTDG
jgi:hypothetical protein